MMTSKLIRTIYVVQQGLLYSADGHTDFCTLYIINFIHEILKHEGNAGQTQAR